MILYLNCSITRKSILLCCLLLIIWSCGNSRFNDFNPDQVEQIAAERLSYYADTLTFQQVLHIPNDKDRLDSLIYIAIWLKDFDEIASLNYAQQAYELATIKNWDVPRAISAYISAARKEEKAKYGEDLEDALVDIYISKRTFDTKDNPAWQSRVNNLLGSIHFRKGNIDSAFFYLENALAILNRQEKLNNTQKLRKAAILQDIANTSVLSDTQTLSLFIQSDSILQTLNEIKRRVRLWNDLGVYYINRGSFIEADSLFQMTIETGKSNEDIDMLSIGYQNKGILYYKKFYQTDSIKYFDLSQQYLHDCLKIQQKSIAKTLEFISLNYYNKWYVLETNDLADSTILYYQKSMKKALEEGSWKILSAQSTRLATFCQFLNLGKCDEILQEETVPFIDSNYKTILNSIAQRSKEAYRRTNTVEKREIEVSAIRERRNQQFLGLGIFIIALLVFLVILQFYRQKRLKAKMDALRAQINPHFISNSLNAIENLVNQNKNKEASKYLIHFSRLSRKILGGSRSADVSLQSELDTLKHFIELEKLRFSNKLDYEVKIAPDVEAKKLQVPAMILQPYVENAIWHGIKPKAGKGKILIEINKDDKYLKCTIIDDGIGRLQSAKLQSTVVLGRKSYGMQITKERLKSIGKSKGSKIEIVDLYDDQQNAMGTKVILSLPLILLKEKKNPFL